MYEAYLKQPIVEGEHAGQYSAIHIKADTEEELNTKRDIYYADSWVNATQEEFVAQFANRTAPVESEADKALGETPAMSEAQPEASPEAQPEAPCAPVDGEAAPEAPVEQPAPEAQPEVQPEA